MKKILAIAISLLTFTGNAVSAPDQASASVDGMLDQRFDFATVEFDPTTAFIDLGESRMMSTDVNEVIAYAKKYLGRPYSYGSKGPKAFDCSGFTSYVFSNFDIKLSPSSKTQSTQGEKVERADIQPGDLLFFKGRRSNDVGHVALAIDVDESGDVTFIHAATKGGVRIDKLDKEPYYRSRYLGARRVIN